MKIMSWTVMLSLLPPLPCFFHAYAPAVKFQRALSSYKPNRFKKVVSSEHENAISIVFLPGTCISPDEYDQFLKELDGMCSIKGIHSNIYNTKFTGDVMHRWEVDQVSEDILGNIPSDNGLVVIGHSAGSFIAPDIAEKVSADCVIQWAGTLNSQGNLPWDSKSYEDVSIPRYTLLSEYDKRVPFTLAIKEFCVDRHNDSFVSFVEGGTHFSGVRPSSSNDNSVVSIGNNYTVQKGEGTDVDILQVAWKMSYAIAGLLMIGDSQVTADRFLTSDNNRVVERFMSLSKGQTRYEISNDIENIASSKLGVKGKVRNFHHSVPGDMLTTFLYIGIHPLRPFIHAGLLYPSFIFSHPDSVSGESHSYSPLSDMNPFALIRSPPTWVKLEGLDKNLKNRARTMNIEIFRSALDSVSSEQRRRYVKDGRKMTFGDDISIPPVPGCSLIWILAPLHMKIVDGKNVMSVHSPVLDIGSRMNAKILSKTQCIEWIVTGSFEKR